MKKIDLNRSVFDLTEEYPELIDIMEDLGFSEITKKAMRYSVGRLTTIPQGAKMKNISMNSVINKLLSNGFQLVGEMPINKDTIKSTEKTSQDGRTELIKEYIKRLSKGEELDNVRADFVKNFNDVDASEIMQAEQEIIKEGVPLEEVQKLCDVHSALFHGATREEKIANAEKAAVEAMKRNRKNNVSYNDKIEKCSVLRAIDGHPLNTFTKENKELEKLLTKAKRELSENSDISPDLMQKIREISIHYAKKGDLLYPHLKVKYEISGPSDVMWTVDDEIRDAFSSLAKASVHNAAWKENMNSLITRAEEMIYKENNILFPICAVNFTDEEWRQIYIDSKDYSDCFGVKNTSWSDGDEFKPVIKKEKSEEIRMPGGHLTIYQLTALLNTIPLEITFVDADNINRYFNEGPKLFKRPSMAIDRDVFSCHPPKIEPMVRAIIEDFRNNRRDIVPVWMEKGGRTVLVKYMAVRDEKGKYVGTVELIQDMEFAKEYFGK